MTRQIIHSRGCCDWQLAVCGDDVTASIHRPTGESVYYTTATFDIEDGDAGRDGLSTDHVVALYRKHAGYPLSFDDLRERVERAVATGATAGGRRVATDGGSPEASAV